MKKITIVNKMLFWGVAFNMGLQIQAAAQGDNNQKRIMGATAQQNAAATLIQAGVRGTLERRAVQQGVAVQSAEMQEQLMPQTELVPQAESAQYVVLMPQIELMNEGERSLAMSLVQSDDSREDFQPSEDNEAINQLLQQNNQDLQAALFDAVGNNRIWALKGLMQRGVNVNIEGQDGFTPLMIAAAVGHLEMVQMLIEKNVNVNAAVQNGNTALILAAAAGHVEIVQMLIVANADINVVNQFADTALMVAAGSGHAEVVRTLLAAKANVNVVSQNGNTALILAADAGRVEIAQMLIVANADVNRAGQNGVTPLMVAAQTDNIQIVQMLLQANADVNVVNQYGASAFTTAAYAGHDEIVRMLITYGAKINAVNRAGSTPLLLASSLGHSKVVQILLEAKADVNIANQNNATALELALAMGHVEIMQMLIAANVDVNRAGQNGVTPLMVAAHVGHVKIVRMLIAANADVNVVNQVADTALILAAQSGHVEIVQMLIAANADVNIVGQNGNTALMLAALAGTIDAVRMLIAAGASIDVSSQNGISALAASSDFEVARLLTDSYRVQLAQRHPENLIEFISRDFDQFNGKSELRSMVNVLNQVGELITSYLLDDDRRNLVNTGCGACIKAAVNGRNGRAHEIKTKLFSAFITSALQKLVSAKEEFADNEQAINFIEKYLSLLNQELAQGYYVREREQQNIESQAHAAACCVVVQQDGPAVAGVDEQAGSVAAQDRQMVSVEDGYAAERVLRAEQNNEYEESVRIDQCRAELERRIAQLMEQLQQFFVEQNSDVASPIVDAVSFEAFQKARDLFAELIVVRAELIDIAKNGLILDPTYAEHKAARIVEQEQVLAQEQAQLQMTESALDAFMSAPTHEEIREQRIKMLGGQAVDRKGKNPAR